MLGIALSRNMALVSIAALLMTAAGPADAAKPNGKANASHMLKGMVIHGKKGVAGAHVHVKHHHAAAAAGGAKAKPARAKVARAPSHHGAMTAANGSFAMKHKRMGTVMLVGHKKGVGKGHARASVGKNGSSGIVIRLHKHHHHHA